MSRRLGFLVGLLPLLGCSVLPRQPVFPPDPLLASKKGVEGRVEDTALESLAHHEPAIPAVPPLVLAARQPNELDRQLEPPPADIVTPSDRLPPYLPASRKKE